MQHVTPGRLAYLEYSAPAVEPKHRTACRRVLRVRTPRFKWWVDSPSCRCAAHPGKCRS